MLELPRCGPRPAQDAAGSRAAGACRAGRCSSGLRGAVAMAGELRPEMRRAALPCVAGGTSKHPATTPGASASSTDVCACPQGRHGLARPRHARERRQQLERTAVSRAIAEAVRAGHRRVGSSGPLWLMVAFVRRCESRLRISAAAQLCQRGGRSRRELAIVIGDCDVKLPRAASVAQWPGSVSVCRQLLSRPPSAAAFAALRDEGAVAPTILRLGCIRG